MSDWQLIIVAVWPICGAITYGAMFAHMQRNWPRIAAQNYRIDMAHAAFFGLFGPIGLLMAVLTTDMFRHGLKWK